ncbi:MAG: pentapeptide repeat-containing protein, partial [Actinomycetales bacterium]|nr:pentapeptide repeat-containing protein [Actinomycetales bacterium]
MTGSPWDGADLSGQVIREVDLSGADLRGAMLANTTIDGYIVGLRVNGVEVV